MITNQSGMKISEDGDVFDHKDLWADNFQLIDASLADIATNVKSFGAKGDGVTDDSPAIQLALDYAYSNGIRTVLVPYTTMGMF
jgi:polygalacturonase